MAAPDVALASDRDIGAEKYPAAALKTGAAAIPVYSVPVFGFPGEGLGK